MIQIASPDIGNEEFDAVKKVLSSGILAQGPVVKEFEDSVAKYCGTKFAVAVNSGTAAIHTALYSFGIGNNDTVITTPFSFIATVNPIIFLRAKPVLVDIDPETFNLDANQIKAKVTPNTKAILPVHLYGQPCDMNEINTIAKSHDLKVIEDACQAIGSQYGNLRAGNLGDAGCFSLYATKNIMSAEGGFITTNNEEVSLRAKEFRQHGMSGPYEYNGIGFNYRMTDLLASIANEQLKKVDRFNEARNQNAELYNMNLKDIEGITIPKTKVGRTHVYHQYTIRVTDSFQLTRDELVNYLRANEIGAGVYYPKPLHLVEHISKFGYKEGDFPNAEQAAREVMSLPIHPKVTKEDVAYICDKIKEAAGAK